MLPSRACAAPLVAPLAGNDAGPTRAPTTYAARIAYPAARRIPDGSLTPIARRDGLPLTIIRPPAGDRNLLTSSPPRPSAPVAIYAPDAPRALFIMGASPDELVNLDAAELVRLVRREAA